MDDAMILAGWYGSLEEYLRGVVPAEMPSSWPMEALKAQAVAACGYAKATALSGHDLPDGRHIDIWIDTRDQAFIPSMARDETDAAVRDTAGIYVIDEAGDSVATQYVSKCGRPDCPYCLGRNGFRGETWTGRMCQFGARFMARVGLGYRDILRRYYGEVKFSDE